MLLHHLLPWNVSPNSTFMNLPNDHQITKNETPILQIFVFYYQNIPRLLHTCNYHCICPSITLLGRYYIQYYVVIMSCNVKDYLGLGFISKFLIWMPMQFLSFGCNTQAFFFLFVFNCLVCEMQCKLKFKICQTEHSIIVKIINYMRKYLVRNKHKYCQLSVLNSFWYYRHISVENLW